MGSNRRTFMKQAGAVGASLGTISVAGCLGSDDDEGRPTEDELPDERMVGEREYVTNTERYLPARFQATGYVCERLQEGLGFNIRNTPEEIGVLVDREVDGDYSIVTYNWCPAEGDPDSVIFTRFHSEGEMNHQNFSMSEYDEIAVEQRQTVDMDERQELVFEAQRILGEQRIENQVVYNEYPLAFNSDRIDPDSVTLKGRFNNVWNWSGMEPLNDEGRTLVTNNWDPSDQLNPLHNNTTGPSRNDIPFQLMHDFLVRVDPEYEPQPWAAVEWNWLDDVTNVVTLRDDMQFHDGEPVTVEDVVYTYELIMETSPPAYSAFVTRVLESVEATGDQEITFTLEDPYAPFVAVTLGTVPILPKHYWQELISETGMEENPWDIVIDDDRPIVGSGPFQWGQWEQGERFEMPAFKDHAFAAPNIDKRIQRPLATRDAELEALRQGDYDILDYWFGSETRLQEAVEEEDHLTLAQGSDVCRQAGWVNTEMPPFDDVAFRQAVNAVFVESQPVIVEEIYNGFGRTDAISPLHPDMTFWHNPDTPYLQGGTDAAIELLTDAGYAWDDDGNLYYPAGVTEP